MKTRDNTLMKLEPIYVDTRKSFYNKAYISLWSDSVVLYSYGTRVSEMSLNTGIITHFGRWSQTTTRHQKEFEAQMQVQQKLAIDNNETLRTRMNHYFGIATV